MSVEGLPKLRLLKAKKPSHCRYCDQPIATDEDIAGHYGIRWGHVSCAMTALETRNLIPSDFNARKRPAELLPYMRVDQPCPYHTVVGANGEVYNVGTMYPVSFASLLKIPTIEDSVEFHRQIEQYIRSREMSTKAPMPLSVAIKAVEAGVPAYIFLGNVDPERRCGPWPTFRERIPETAFPRAERGRENGGFEQRRDHLIRLFTKLEDDAEARFRRITREWPQCRHMGVVRIVWSRDLVTGVTCGRFVCSVCDEKPK